MAEQDVPTFTDDQIGGCGVRVSFGGDDDFCACPDFTPTEDRDVCECTHHRVMHATIG